VVSGNDPSGAPPVTGPEAEASAGLADCSAAEELCGAFDSGRLQALKPKVATSTATQTGSHRFWFSVTLLKRIEGDDEASAKKGKAAARPCQFWDQVSSDQLRGSSW
jgi:hypothetical protein